MWKTREKYNWTMLISSHSVARFWSHQTKLGSLHTSAGCEQVRFELCEFFSTRLPLRLAAPCRQCAESCLADCFQPGFAKFPHLHTPTMHLAYYACFLNWEKVRQKSLDDHQSKRLQWSLRWVSPYLPIILFCTQSLCAGASQTNSVARLLFARLVASTRAPGESVHVWAVLMLGSSACSNFALPTKKRPGIELSVAQNFGLYRN